MARDGARTLTGAGAPESVIELNPLPAGAVTARFADPLHAMAVGETLAEVWVSDDGAA